VAEIEHRADLAHALVDFRSRHAAIAQRKGEIVVDCHGVVDDRELEHLRDIPLFRACFRHVLGVEPDLSVARPQQAGDEIEQRGLAAAGRAEQRVGAAVA
jgi:hypothetical protein